MEKISFKNFSLLGLALMGVSALTAAFIPSKAKSDASAQGKLFLNGHQIQSTIGGVQVDDATPTVTVFANGGASWTATGLPFDDGDGLSATSADDLGTDTAEVGNATRFATTIGA